MILPSPPRPNSNFPFLIRTRTSTELARRQSAKGRGSARTLESSNSFFSNGLSTSSWSLFCVSSAAYIAHHCATRGGGDASGTSGSIIPLPFDRRPKRSCVGGCDKPKNTEKILLSSDEKDTEAKREEHQHTRTTAEAEGWRCTNSEESGSGGSCTERTASGRGDCIDQPARATRSGCSRR
jgi:hypothetical protein